MTTDGDGGVVNKQTVKPPLDQLVVNLLDLVFENLLLEGSFGRVYQRRPATAGQTQGVMVKTIWMGLTEKHTVKLVTESSTLYPVLHKHVVPLLATSDDLPIPQPWQSQKVAEHVGDPDSSTAAFPWC